MRKTLLLKKGLVTAAFTFAGALTAFADSVVLYESDFSTDPSSEWTVLDKSTAGNVTWTWKSGAVYNPKTYGYAPGYMLVKDWDAPQNDYCISPAMDLKAGVKYTVTTAAVRQSGSDDVTLELGTSTTDASTYSVKKTLSPASGYGDDMYETTEISVDADGTYYFAYHVNQAATNSMNIVVCGLKVTYEDASVVDPTPDPDPDQPGGGEATVKKLLDTDFSTQPTDWTILDKSTAGNVTWTWKSGAVYNPKTFGYAPGYMLVKDWDAPQNDYLISPALEMKAGVKYTVTTAAVRQSGSDDITLELGTSTTDASTYSIKKTLSPASGYGDDMYETTEITVDADGTYYLAYHVNQTATNSMNIAVLGMTVSYEEGSSTPDKPDTPDQPSEDDAVLKADFATEPADWTKIHKGNNGEWTWNSYGMGGHAAMRFMQSQWYESVDDYTVSPAVELKKGRLYTITTEAAYEAGIPTLTLEYGTNNADATSFTKVSDITPAATYDDRTSEIKDFTVAQDGTYYFAYHMYQTDAASRKAYVFGLKVVDAGEAPVVTPTPAAVTALEGAVDYDAATVTLTWTNPTKDAEGNELTEKVGAKIYKGEETEPIKTIDELTGETTSVAVSPEPFEGDVTFTVKTFIGEKESEAATVSLNLDKPVIPDTSKELPYTADMTDAETAKDFTVLDANNDNITWATVEGINGLTYDSDNATAAANDWVITPAIKFAENTNYAVVANFTRSGAFDNDVVEVYAGDEATAEKMTKKIGSVEIADNAAEAKLRYICADANAKFIGFHIATPNGDNGQISLTSVSISAIESATPLAVENLDAQVNSDDKTVTLTWANPTKDTEGYDIAQTVGVKVYENDVLVKTLDDATEGKLVYSPENFSGEATYKVVSFIGDKDGEAASKTVNLDDLNGELVLVRAFEFTKTAANYWTIINADKNTSKWAFDYDCFLFSGGSEADDWLISPAASLSKKDRYVLKYQMKTAWKPSNNDFYADVDVTIGNGTTAEAQTTVLKSYKGLSQNSFTEYKTSQFSVAEDGQYNIGFHVTGINGNMSMRNLAIYSIGEPTTGINEIVNSGVVAYNKANGALFLPAGSKMALYAANGSVAMQAVADGQAINLNSLANGIYVMKVTTAEGKVMTRKIVK